MSGDDEHWANQPRDTDGKWTDGGGSGGAGGAGAGKALRAAREFVPPARREGENDNSYRSRVSRARTAYRREAAAAAPVVQRVQREVPNPRHAETRQQLKDTKRSVASARDDVGRALGRLTDINETIGVKNTILEGRRRREAELREQRDAISVRKEANVNTGDTRNNPTLGRLRSALETDRGAVNAGVLRSERAIAQLREEAAASTAKLTERRGHLVNLTTRKANLRDVLSRIPETRTETVEKVTSPIAAPIEAESRRALQGHFTRRLNAERAAQGLPRASSEEAHRLFEAHMSASAPRTGTAARPQGALFDKGPREAPTIHGVKLKLTDRTPAEVASIRSHNEAKLTAKIGAERAKKTAQALEMAFGARTPKIEELEAAYSTKDHKATLFVSGSPGSYATSISIEGHIKHSVTGEDVNETLSRSYQKQGDNLSVYHACFRVKPEYQATGIGREILANSVRFNHEMGVRKIGVSPLGAPSFDTYEAWERKQSALKETKKKLKDVLERMATHKGKNHTEFNRAENEFQRLKETARSQTQNWNGPFVWASMGFKWEADVGRDLGSQFANYLRDHHRIDAAKARTIADRIKYTPHDLARAEVNGKKVGAHFLQSYVRDVGHCTMDMKKDNPAWVHMKKYLGVDDLDP